MLLVGLAAFAAAFVYDLSVARYFGAMTDRAAARATLWSVTCYVLALVSSWSVLKYSMWLAIPEALGVAGGTYCGVRWRRPDELPDSHA